MSHLLHSEWVKITTTKLMWWMGIAAFLFGLLNLAVPLGIGMAVDDTIFNDPEFVNALFTSTMSAALFALVLGIVAMTSEYRHNTIAPTYLATPKRDRVLLAKTIVLAVLGAVIGALAYLANVVIVFIVLATKTHADVSFSIVLANLGWTVLGFALFAAIGVTLGALLRGQATAIVVAVVWLLVVEGIVAVIKPEIAKWFPGQALKSLSSTDISLALTTENPGYLPTLTAVVVLIAYVVVFGLAAALTTLRRDVT